MEGDGTILTASLRFRTLLLSVLGAALASSLVVSGLQDRWDVFLRLPTLLVVLWPVWGVLALTFLIVSTSGAFNRLDERLSRIERRIDAVGRDDEDM